MEERNEIFDAHLVTEVELIYKNPLKPSQRPQVTTSKAAYEIFYNTWDKDKIELLEQFKIMLLNRANKVLGIFIISTGGITATVVDIRLIFAAAIKANATSILLAHNHPSGATNPSVADKQITEKIVSAGKILDISVFDHLIITKHGYFSFADNGLL
ncbi:JAB domain-containing protein [Sphingobacterium faecium]|uniref:JAB domain-containing protein n=1 Tax=Sphingobacterium faecium TaxID=34087 RepID=UPI00320A855A